VSTAPLVTPRLAHGIRDQFPISKLRAVDWPLTSTMAALLLRKEFLARSNTSRHVAVVHHWQVNRLGRDALVHHE
jgi:hypothetical protein